IDWKPVMLPRFKARYVTARAKGQVAGYRYKTVKLDHGTAGSNGYRLHVGSKILAYSGDTEPTAPLERLVDGADVALVEATGPGGVVSNMRWEGAGALRKWQAEERVCVACVALACVAFG